MLLSRLGRTHAPSGPRQPPTHVERFSSFDGNSPPAAALECGMETMEHSTRFADDWRPFAHWVPVPGFEGWYSVNLATGDVRRDRPGPSTRVGRILNPYLDRDGYRVVNLYKHGIMFPRHAHVLVCEAFRGPRPMGKQACHFDGNKLNNAGENLRWGTAKDNTRDRVRHGTDASGERNPSTSLPKEKVIDVQLRFMHHMKKRRSEGFSKARYGFGKALQEETGLTHMPLWEMLTGRSWKEEYQEAERLFNVEE